MIRFERKDLRLWIPEIQDAAPDLREAFEAALSFPTWDHLRAAQRLGPKKAEAVVLRLLESLAAALPGAKD